MGCSAVIPVLEGAGFREVEVFGPHAAPDGDFPNVPKHVANPENAAVFDAMIEHGRPAGRRSDPGDRSRLRPAGLRRAGLGAARRGLDHAHRQPDRLRC